MIRQVILTPPACSQAAPCPCGSYCSDDVGGICLVDCRSDAECAPGKTCSPWGQCLGGASNDAGIPPNPSCPRNLMLLMSPGTLARPCQFDDTCPFGSHCGPSTGLCTYECTSDSDCASDAGTSMVCSCLGTCVPLGGQPAPSAGSLPTLSVTPLHFSLPPITGDPPTQPDWGNNNERVFYVTLTSTTAPTAPPPEITVTPGTDLTATCPNYPGGPGPCKFTPADYVVQPDGTYATALIPILVTPNPSMGTVGDSSWTVRVGTEGAAGSPKVITLRYSDPPPAGGGALAGGSLQTVTTLSGPFQGAGTLEFTSPTGQAMQIPVLGVQTNFFNLLLYDASKTLSPSGKIALGHNNFLTADPSLVTNDYVEFTSAHVNSALGVYGSVIKNLSLAQRVVNGDIQEVSATFDLSFFAGRGIDPAHTTDPIQVKLDLKKAQGPAFCPNGSTAGNCDDGTTCDLGFCSPDRAPLFTDFDNLGGATFLTAAITLGDFSVPSWRVDDIAQNDSATLATAIICEPSFGLQGPVLPISGDLSCWNGQANTASYPPSNVVPLVDHRDLEIAKRRQEKTATELLKSCLGDLERSDPLDRYASHSFSRIYGGGGGFPGPDIPDGYLSYNTADCVSVGAWQVATFLARRDGSDPSLLHRLLQQWVEVHTFVTREALQERELDDVLGSEATPGPSLDTALLEQETGWAWVIDAVGQLKNFLALNLDYRHLGDVAASCFSNTGCANGRVCDVATGHCVARSLSSSPEYEAAAGLPTTMLQGATAHLQLVDKLVGDRLRQSFGSGASSLDAVAAGGRGLRFALVVEAMASTLKGDYDGLPNCTDCQDPAFIARWNAALREFQAARTSLVNTMATVRTGMNPLGIFDNDAPLYFGDPQGTNSRYFAGSDYLLDGWAVPAVATAQTSLNAARDAWVAQQNSLVQDEEAQANRAHYVDQLKSTYASKILNNCGPLEGGQLGEADVLDAVKNGQIDLDTCYINPSCLGTDDVSNAAIRHQVIKQSFNADVATFNLCMWDQLKDAAPSMNPPLLPQSRIPPNNLSGGLGSPQQKVDLLTLIHPTATSFLHTQTPETGYTDISCFLEGTENQVIPRCDCGDDSGSALPSDNANACNAKTGCWTVCGPKKCQGPMGVQVCTDNTCTPEHPQGCTYPNNCLFRRDFMATNPQYHGRPPSESEMIPDMGFETHPWTQVTTQQVGNSVIVTTGLPRRTTGQNCKIPADYFYGYVPDSWHYQDLSLVLPAQWLQAYVTCSSGAKITDVMSTPGLDADVRYPFADSPLPVPEMADTCFSGAMGTSARTLRGAALQLKHSQETVSANAGHLDDVFNLCLKDKDNAQKAAEAHKAELTAWEVLGVAAAVVAAAAATYVTAGAAAPGLAAAAGYTGAAATAAAATITTGVTAAAVLSTGIGGFLAIQREQINENIAKLEAQFANDNTVQSCWNEYRQTLRNMAGLETEIEQASNTVTVEAGNLGRLKDENQQAFQDGEAKLTIEQGRKYGSYAHSYWFDDKVSRFRTEFEWSRKLTYLAMLAVEYEFQQSLPYRGDVLTAANPDKLEQVVLGLKQEQISRTVNGRRPESASTVISLRDDVLTIDDRSQITIAGERNWTPAQRFEGRLRNGGYAYYASDGTYLGQGVPFDLAPQGILEDRCGERMWRVTATIQGDGLSDTTPNAPILLLKSNTFSSQWCDTGGADIPGMQSSSVHPTTQLFRPGDSPVTSDATGFTPALMYPWFNIRRTDFYKQTYQDGSSEELAGRGLYGQYVLLFPKQLLDSGFPLEKVEDVLLRIDYLSVDNLPQ